MGKPGKQRRRKGRQTKKLRQLKTKRAQTRTILQMGESCPDLGDFIASLDTSGINRLLGIFRCSPDEHLATETILEKHGYAGYRMLQCEIDGAQTSGGDGKARGWAAAVKREEEQDEQFRIFVGIVERPLTGNSGSDMSGRWGAVIAVVHELGHAYDMDQGISFHLGQPLRIEESEYVAHEFACQFLRKREMTMGLTAYLSMAVCPMVNDESAIAVAARRFMASEEYRLALQEIPPYIRRQLGVTEAP